eukprot:CAMPEP_0194068240 /NCGR_PEP_ID=MMETSP0009_2-20130614/86982_1 /TAXON_ID=210454 /ORGANISM="Grammatophora oceanica, Strain CCMP 410" /LENGTH=326 /DNA_ID=CAMNT_0038721317 /DNA_START=78 /DNA_END=1057 /DNA_ORIENTATION=-
MTQSATTCSGPNTSTMFENLSRSLVRMSPRTTFRRTITPPAPVVGKEEDIPLEAASTSSSDDEEPLPQRHTFPVSKKEISRGDHTVAVVWLMREMPKAKKLELRYFTGDTKEMSFEFTWQAEDGVSRSIDMEVSAFLVSKKEISRGDHTVAVVWLMREMPKAKKLELRYFTGDTKEMSFEFTWQAEDGVSRSIDMEVSRSQVIPMGTTLLTVVAESCTNLRELTIYTGLERINELSLSKVLKAFSVAAHWEKTLENLELSWSCVEQGTFTGMQTFPQQLKSIKFDGCLMIDEIEVNEFVSRLPVLESFQVVGSERTDDRNVSMISI